MRATNRISMAVALLAGFWTAPVFAGQDAVNMSFQLGRAVQTARACGIDDSRMLGVTAMFYEANRLEELKRAGPTSYARNDASQPGDLTSAFLRGAAAVARAGQPSEKTCTDALPNWKMIDDKCMEMADALRTSNDGLKKLIDTVKTLPPPSKVIFTFRPGDPLAKVAEAFPEVQAHLMAQHPGQVGNKYEIHLADKGVWFFAGPNGIINTIRVDAPFTGVINGVCIGDSLATVYQLANNDIRQLPVSGVYGRPAYLFTSSGGSRTRIDLGPANTVASIFLLRG